MEIQQLIPQHPIAQEEIMEEFLEMTKNGNKKNQNLRGPAKAVLSGRSKSMSM